MELREALHIARCRMDLDWPEVSKQLRKKVSYNLNNDDAVILLCNLNLTLRR